jgi:heterodisulfide reductase subunit A
VATQGDLSRALATARHATRGASDGAFAATADGRDHRDLASLKSVVMIQCVGPWDKQDFYCSRLCCAAALENALALKALNPRMRVHVLMKEMRAYGFKEELYTEARAKGVIFVRYTDERPPTVRSDGGRAMVSVDEPILGARLEIPADLVVLSTALVAPEGARSVSDALKIPLTAEGFFLEAHPKLRPVDFASEGIFLCGAAHYPKSLEEAISQGLAAAGRAATILSKESLRVGGVVAQVNPARCAACLTCVRVCPYEVPAIGASKVAEIEVARCQGCGVCAAECPNDAIQLQHYRDEQVMVKTAALLAGV